MWAQRTELPRSRQAGFMGGWTQGCRGCPQSPVFPFVSIRQLLFCVAALVQSHPYSSPSHPYSSPRREGYLSHLTNSLHQFELAAHHLPGPSCRPSFGA